MVMGRNQKPEKLSGAGGHGPEKKSGIGDILSQSLAVTLTSHFIIRSCGAYFLLSNDAPFYLFACIISAKTTTTEKTRK